MTTTQTEIESVTFEELVPFKEDNDGRRKAHIVNPPDNPHISNGYPNMTGQDVVTVARMNGLEVTALCGFKFIPQYNPDSYDACDPCMKIAGDIMRSEG